MTNPDICQRLEQAQATFASFSNTLSEETFFDGSDERWSPAHHLGHLTLTYNRLTTGFKSKERLPEYTKTPRSYEEVREAYLTALNNTPPALLANNPFAVQLDGSAREDMMQAFLQAGQDLREAATAWSETELDTKGLKHPLLGLISAREMLCFVLYHDGHHLLGVQKLIENYKMGKFENLIL